MQYYDSPCGTLLLASCEDRLCMCDWAQMKCVESNKLRIQRLLHAEFREEPSAILHLAEKELNEYFAGARRVFDIPLLLIGTDFQKSVWEALLEIPYGVTRSYMEIAKRVGNAKGVRAVAQAIGSNGISIIVPCHRVIGSNQSLTGFAGGLDAKRFLLALETPLFRNLR